VGQVRVETKTSVLPFDPFLGNRYVFCCMHGYLNISRKPLNAVVSTLHLVCTVGWTYPFVHVRRVDKRPSNVGKRLSTWSNVDKLFVHVEKVGTGGQTAVERGQKFAHVVKSM
jgi:hypothetical protein